MSLVRRLEVERVVTRRRLMEKAGNYLSASGTGATLDEEPATDIMGMSTSEPVLRLNGHNFDSIRVLSSDYLSCGMAGGISRFQYEVRAGSEIGHQLDKKLKAKVKLVKENKAFGLLGGKVTGVTWTGGELADLLNSDGEISGKLADCAESRGNPDFQVIVTGPSTVTILGPSFADMDKIEELFESGAMGKHENCIFGFKICDRIAGHIRELLAEK